MKRTIFLIAILFFSLASVFSQANRELTKSEATRMFEKFVKDNRYANLPPAQYVSKYTFKVLGDENYNNAIKPLRFNMLTRKPFRVMKIKDGWSAIFFYRSKNLGREIYMDFYGENIKVEYQDTHILGNL